MDCPLCNTRGLPVPYVTVRSLVMSSTKSSAFFLCMKPSCSVAYFSPAGEILPIDFLSVPIWFKNSDYSVPICYCAHLTRGEIIEAVKKGCKTIIEVRELTRKTTTGKCRRKNPSGTCCHKTLQELIHKTKTSIQDES